MVLRLFLGIVCKNNKNGVEVEVIINSSRIKNNDRGEGNSVYRDSILL